METEPSVWELYEDPEPLEIDMQNHQDLEQFLVEQFPNDPYALTVNLAMCVGLLARASRTAYATRSDNRWLFGSNSQKLYTDCLSCIYAAGQDRYEEQQATTARGDTLYPPANTPWHALYDSMTERKKYHENDDTEPFLDYLGRHLQLQRRFAYDGELNNIASLALFSMRVRLMSEEVFGNAIHTPYFEAEIEIPGSFIHPQLLYEFSDSWYWRMADTPYISRQRAITADPVFRTNVIDLHRRLAEAKVQEAHDDEADPDSYN